MCRKNLLVIKDEIITNVEDFRTVNFSVFFKLFNLNESEKYLISKLIFNIFIEGDR